MSKDRKPKKKLSLKKERLKTLSNGELAKAAGGLSGVDCAAGTDVCASDYCNTAGAAATDNCGTTVYASGYCKTMVATGYCTL